MAADAPPCPPWEASQSWRLISQGAEGRVFQCTLFGTPCIAKQRVSKSYRHPVLDQTLRRQRLVQEARVFQRCQKAGVPVPTLRFVDNRHHILFMSEVRGHSLKHTIRHAASKDELLPRMEALGEAVAIMHDNQTIHGDLTTSNVMVEEGSPGVVLIDFGLSFVSTNAEDKAVDIYVLERAFLSTHPDSQDLFDAFMKKYSKTAKCFSGVGQRLHAVRKRGRKREAFG